MSLRIGPHASPLLYLLVMLIAPWGLIYVQNALFAGGVAAATIARITTHETLFRLGLAADGVCGFRLHRPPQPGRSGKRSP